MGIQKKFCSLLSIFAFLSVMGILCLRVTVSKSNIPEKFINLGLCIIQGPFLLSAMESIDEAEVTRCGLQYFKMANVWLKVQKFALRYVDILHKHEYTFCAISFTTLWGESSFD